MGMAFDASFGATKEEIMEALRVAQHLSGVGCVYVGNPDE